MKQLGLGLTTGQIEQCIGVLDKDGDGEVSYNEFMELVEGKNDRPITPSGINITTPDDKKSKRTPMARPTLTQGGLAGVAQSAQSGYAPKGGKPALTALHLPSPTVLPRRNSLSLIPFGKLSTGREFCRPLAVVPQDLC